MRIYSGPALDWMPTDQDAVLVTIDARRDGIYMTVEYADGTPTKPIHVGGREGLALEIVRIVDEVERSAAA